MPGSNGHATIRRRIAAAQRYSHDEIEAAANIDSHDSDDVEHKVRGTALNVAGGRVYSRCNRSVCRSARACHIACYLASTQSESRSILAKMGVVCCLTEAGTAEINSARFTQQLLLLLN